MLVLTYTKKLDKYKKWTTKISINNRSGSLLAIQVIKVRNANCLRLAVDLLLNCQRQE